MTIDHEFLDDRRAIWGLLGDMSHGEEDPKHPKEPWWVLRCDPAKELKEYKDLLQNNLQCDDDSVGHFVALVRLKTPEGFSNGNANMEALRVIYHLIKDKDLTWQDPRRSYGEKNSKYLKTACLEALDALACPELWEQGPSATARGASKGKWQGKGEALASAPQDRGKGKGMSQGFR